jgi:hypothetical protein
VHGGGGSSPHGGQEAQKEEGNHWGPGITFKGSPQ